MASRGEATGCAASGCTQADWRKNWKMSSSADGWNTVRIRFYGGLSQNQSNNGDKVHMQSWARSKLDVTNTTVSTINWIALFKDSLVLTGGQASAWPTNPVGLQVHGGGRFGAPRGTWYRNMKMRELDSLGRPTYIPTPIVSKNGEANYELKTTMDGLVGRMPLDHQIRVSDLSGRVLQQFSGHSGYVNYTLADNVRGFLLVEVKTSQGVQHLHISRLFK
jgi:hypothetical protein